MKIQKTMATATTKTKTNELPPNPFVSEILDLASKQRSNAKKVEVLQRYKTDALMSILIWNFDESVISMLPEGPVPFKPNDAPAGTEHTSIRSESRNFYNFVKGGNDSLSKTRRETIFIQILETLHPEEAQLLVLCKDKQLQSKYKITKQVVADAFPEIQWGNRS